MRILFVHQNFPGQFRHLAPALVERGHEVTAFSMQADAAAHWRGVRVVRYAPQRHSTPEIHPWLADFETKTIRGEAVFRAAMQLKAAGYAPDVIVAHPGWGESLFLKDVWPDARFGLYCEFHYRHRGADLDFDPEFPPDEATSACQMRLRNINNLVHFEFAEAGISPTRWQAASFPQPFRERISIVHDGVDTQALVPNPDVGITLNGNLVLSRRDEVVTYVSRTLEPYRGYHVFMRALPQLLRERPHARVLIVGGDSGGYGKPAPPGSTWREIFLKEALQHMTAADAARVFYLGSLPYASFVAVLQLSTVHVYLTYPFVLSWSLLEAMSVGCAIVASDTPPVQEVIRDGDNGKLVPFFDADALAGTVAHLLADGGARGRLGAKARADMVAGYDLRRVCLPSQIAWVEALGRGAQ